MCMLENARVFPLSENPTRKGSWKPKRRYWQERAQQITNAEWQELSQGNDGYGLCTGDEVAPGQYLFVIDFDKKHGKDGFLSFDLLYGLNSLPETYSVKTPSGGTHFYYTAPFQVACGTDVLCPGVDIRGRGGYVVCPGSPTPDLTKGYVVDNQADIAAAPGFILAVLGSLGDSGKREKNEALVETDLEGNIQEAIAYLKRVKPAIEGSGGDLHTYSVACMVRDHGVSSSVCSEIMLEYFNPRCVPPWNPEELEVKIESAYRNALEPLGCKAVETTDWLEDHGPEPKKDSTTLVRYSDLASPNRNTPKLIQGLLSSHGLTTLYGPPNAGKSFIALSMALAIATGSEWAGHKTTKTAVVYVAAEGLEGIINRVAALHEHTGVHEAPLYLLTRPVDFLHSDTDLLELVTAIRKTEDRERVTVGLVIVDTLCRAMAGGDENSSTDMGAFVKNMDSLRNILNSVVLLIHHTGKDVDRGARGHSSLRGAVDSEIKVNDGRITFEKQRDMEKGNAIPFSLKVVELGEDDTGEALTSCVAVFDSADSDFEMNQPLSGRDSLFLSAFRNAAIRGLRKGTDYVSLEDWISAIAEESQSHLSDSDKFLLDAGSLPRMLRKSASNLTTAGMIQELSKDLWTLK